jgi:hypothetical protein
MKVKIDKLEINSKITKISEACKGASMALKRVTSLEEI